MIGLILMIVVAVTMPLLMFGPSGLLRTHRTLRAPCDWKPEDNRPGSGSALDVLRRRYPSGELRKDQYEQMRQVLIRF